MSEQALFAIMEPAHYLAVAIGIATIVAMVARARKQENASRALRSPRPLSKASIWIPLKNRIFRNLWVASLLSGSAVSAYDTAATWLMNTMTPSPLFLSLMSTFATLPFFLFTLPAGVLADMFDRKKLLCFMNLWLALVAAGLAIANGIGLANPYLILGTVFLLGIGFAFNAPAWTAIIPEVVTKEDLPSATTLGGLQLNISGIVGPAIGGLVLARLGVNFVFAINSVCFLLVILAVLRWKSLREASRVPLEGFMESLASAIRYISAYTRRSRCRGSRFSLRPVYLDNPCAPSRRWLETAKPECFSARLSLHESFNWICFGCCLRRSDGACEVLSEQSDNPGDCAADFGLLFDGLHSTARSFSLGRRSGWRCLDRGSFGALGSWPDRRAGIGKRPAKRRIYDGVECEYGDWRNSLGRACSIQGIGIYVARRLHSSPNQSAVAFPVFYRRGSGT